ncbi:hypothetical protein K466DRAFT_586068 [Polyporus arcularius HHB13444]|uniref:DUF6533 domain-containing protein n=1 Tax=Polyporus arcularius HHB13444 TaxID=1314778 RepID=A0A5C3PEW8_9APHY|nr:hypothetical protein K466DRAFT_586068 [Polyporus arcularius HHB13444]
MTEHSYAAAAAASLYNRIYTDKYCEVAAAVLFTYDSLITFDRELAYFWTAKRISGASLLFFANKWISTMLYATAWIHFASFPSNKVSSGLHCSVFADTQWALFITQFIPGAAFSALRVYVLSRRKLLGLLVFALSLAPVGGNLAWYGYHFSGENLPPFGCLRTDNTTPALDLRNGAVVLISRVPLILSDMILIYITWIKLSSWVVRRHIKQSRILSLSDILLHGGIILLILNIVHITFTSTELAGGSFSGGSELPLFTGLLTTVIISRFLLELQQANQVAVRVDLDDSSQALRDPWDSTPSFISSLGGFINSDHPALSEDDDAFESQVGALSEARGMATTRESTQSHRPPSLEARDPSPRT